MTPEAKPPPSPLRPDPGIYENGAPREPTTPDPLIYERMDRRTVRKPPDKRLALGTVVVPAGISPKIHQCEPPASSPAKEGSFGESFTRRISDDSVRGMVWRCDCGQLWEALGGTWSKTTRRQIRRRRRAYRKGW